MGSYDFVEWRGYDEFIVGDSNRQTVTSVSNLRETHPRDSSEWLRVEEKEHACDLLGRFGLDVRVEERSKMLHALLLRDHGLRLRYAVWELDRRDVTVLDAPAHECTGETSRGGTARQPIVNIRLHAFRRRVSAFTQVTEESDRGGRALLGR